MKTYTEEELKAVLSNHAAWLEAGRPFGDTRRADLTDADLRYADLTGADLRYADLRYADLTDANLTGADLTGANLTGANLRYANLRYADLRYADLRYANLSYADLTDAKGYLSSPEKEVEERADPPTPTTTPPLNATQPNYYRFEARGASLDIIDVIQGLGLGCEAGNVYKYLARAGKKDASKHIEDLEKAREWLDRLIEFRRRA